MKKLLFSILSVAGLSGGMSAQCSTASTPGNNCTYGDYINSFSLNSIAASGNGGCSTGGYASYSSPVWTLTPNSNVTWNVTTGSYAQGIGIWIDWNNDGTYAN